MSGRGLIVAATRSGTGKTVITLAVLAALRGRGIAVRAAKAGPDYIDPGFHAAATGGASRNLDSWAMPPGLLDALVAEAVSGAEMLVVEGVMGLFDGVDGASGRRGSTADLAARFGFPVLLVLDVAGQSQSAAAMVRGFATHDPAVRIAGAVLNRVGSESPRGDGRFGQADLAGNVTEWVQDFDVAYPNPCDNCAALSSALQRVTHGGGYTDGGTAGLVSSRGRYPPITRDVEIGARCAR